ncbi:MAG: hypothetical protein C0442_04865 [Chlorobiaceae bacterium]|nr:hypothetical protein [Chlorobiaceae bacterium]
MLIKKMIKSSNLKYLIFSSLVAIFFLKGCTESVDAPQRGKATIYVDESVINMVEAQVEAFVKLYPEAIIQLDTLTAREGIVKILNDEAELFISSRELNKEEVEFIQKTNREVRVNKICFDGVVVIASKQMGIDRIKLSDLKDLLRGDSKKYRVFIPQKNSGIYEYLHKDILEGAELAGVEVVNSEFDIKEKVLNTRNSIGLLGYNTLDEDTSEVRMLKIGWMKNPTIGEIYFEPHQAYFINGDYPLTRLIYFILNDKRFGVATGFSSFLTGNEGQTIIKEEKLGPATVPVKLVPSN